MWNLPRNITKKNFFINLKNVSPWTNTYLLKLSSLKVYFIQILTLYIYKSFNLKIPLKTKLQIYFIQADSRSLLNRFKMLNAFRDGRRAFQSSTTNEWQVFLISWNDSSLLYLEIERMWSHSKDFPPERDYFKQWLTVFYLNRFISI